MRIDKYSMAKGWMMQEDATPEEAKATWDTLETEFEDKRKAQLMASAETDEIIKTINDKFGPGTMFPASDAPIPPMTDTQRIMEWEERNRKADGGRIPFGKGGDVEGLKIYLKNLPDGSEVNVKELAKKFKVSRSTVSNHRTILRPELKVAFNLPETKGTGTLTEGILKAYEDLGKGKNTTSVDIYNEIKDLDAFKDYSRRDLLNTIGKRLRTNNKPYTKTAGATSDAAEETKQTKRKIYLDKKVNQPTIVYKATKPGGPSEIMNIKFPETGNNTKAAFKKAIENYYSIPKDDAKIKVAKNKIIKDFFPDGLGEHQWNKLVGFFNKQEDIDTKRPYLYGDEGGSQKVSREDRLSKKEEFSDKIFEDRISDEKRALIKEKGLLKNPNFKAGYEPIDLAHRLSLGTSKRFNIQQKTGTIGLDRPVVNQVFMEYYQSKLNKVYNLQRDLIINKPKDWRKKLETGNKLITSIVNDADNRLVGVMIDEKTLKPILFGDKLAAKYAIDQGLFDTEIKNLSSKDKEFIKKFLLEPQIMREVDTGLDVKNFRNINKDSITKWMNKTGRINTELKNQTLKILEDNPQITKSQGALGTKDSQPQVKKIINQVTGGDPKLNKFVSQNFMPSGLSGPFEMLSDDLKKIVNSEGFKTWKAKIANPALTAAGKAARLPTKFFGVADLALGYLDYSNNRQKGWSVEDSKAHMIETLLFGFGNMGEEADMAGVKKVAMEKYNMSSEVFDQLVESNKNQNEVQKIITDFAKLNKDTEERIKSGFADESTENLILLQNKDQGQKRLKVLMKEAIEREPSLKTNLQIQEAGAPININVDKEKALADLSKSSYDFVQQRIKDSDLEKTAMYDDTTMGGIGARTKMTIGDPEWWLNLSLGRPWEETSAMKRFKGMHQLKKEDPTLYYKMLLSEGVDPRMDMNLPVHLEWEQKYPYYGTPISDEIKKSTSYSNGGIASLRRKK